MNTVASLDPFVLAHFEVADPCKGLAASLFLPRRVRERDHGQGDSPLKHVAPPSSYLP
jgi:hypothetical protein